MKKVDVRLFLNIFHKELDQFCPNILARIAELGKVGRIFIQFPLSVYQSNILACFIVEFIGISIGFVMNSVRL